MNGDELIARAEAATCSLAEAGRTTDSQGLSPDILATLAGTGLFRLGGALPEPAAVAEALRRLARGCASSAYLAAILHENRIRAALLSDLGRAGLQGDGDVPFIASASLPDQANLVTNTTGGDLSGHWRAVPGVAYADWIWLTGRNFSALVAKAEIIHAPRSQLGGLRGVGWSDVAAHDLFVPTERIGQALQPVPGTELRSLALVLGVAEGAYEDYVSATRARISGIGGKAVATFTQVQVRVAESQADLKAAAALWSGLAERKAGELDAEARRDLAFVARLCLDAVTRLVRQMGAMGLVESNPVQRRYRDLRTLAAAPELDWNSSLAARGRQILGIDTAPFPSADAA